MHYFSFAHISDISSKCAFIVFAGSEQLQKVALQLLANLSNCGRSITDTLWNSLFESSLGRVISRGSGSLFLLFSLYLLASWQYNCVGFPLCSLPFSALFLLHSPRLQLANLLRLLFMVFHPLSPTSHLGVVLTRFLSHKKNAHRHLGRCPSKLYFGQHVWY